MEFRESLKGKLSGIFPIFMGISTCDSHDTDSGLDYFSLSEMLWFDYAAKIESGT